MFIIRVLVLLFLLLVLFFFDKDVFLVFKIFCFILILGCILVGWFLFFFDVSVWEIVCRRVGEIFILDNVFIFEKKFLKLRYVYFMDDFIYFK